MNSENFEYIGWGFIMNDCKTDDHSDASDVGMVRDMYIWGS